MKLFEIADPKDADLFHVHGGDDIFGALKASLMHDWIDVGLEAKQDLTMEQVDEDIINLTAIIKKIIKHKPGYLGSSYLHFDVDNSVQLKKMLDAFDAYFDGQEWRWVCTVEGQDEDV